VEKEGTGMKPFIEYQKNWLIWILAITAVIVICSLAHAAEITASWYNRESCLREGTSGIMANGKELKDGELTAASWDYSFGTYLRVTNLNNNKTVIVEITDRGPNKKLYNQGRKIDLSYEAMYRLDGIKQGVVPVKIEVIR